jgi:hypothetical protein
MHPEEKSVAITVALDAHDVENGSRALSLAPQSTATATEEVRVSGVERELERLAVHIGDHEHGPGAHLLGDRDDKTVASKLT